MPYIHVPIHYGPFIQRLSLNSPEYSSTSPESKRKARRNGLHTEDTVTIREQGNSRRSVGMA